MGRATTYPRRGLTLVEVIIVVAVIFLLVALALPATQMAREASRRTQCAVHLRQLGVAMQGYHADHACFPPDAVGYGHSHFAIMLPYLGLNELYNSINFQALAPVMNLPLGADWKANKTASETSVSLFLCPSDVPPPPRASGRQWDPAWTNYAGVDNAWPGRANGIFGNSLFLKWPVRAGDIRGGLSSTVAMSEWQKGVHVRGGKSPLRPVWLSGCTSEEQCPEACQSLSTETATIALSTKGIAWSHASTAQTLYDHVGPPNSLSCTESGAGIAASSMHPGGVNTLFADGHVRFLSNAIDTNLWRALGDRTRTDPLANSDF
jgi:prepilin-type processing-associated H-X9-DG protein